MLLLLVFYWLRIPNILNPFNGMALTIIAYIVVGLYTLALIYITFYCLIQLHLLLKYGKDKRLKIGALTDLSGFGNTLPAVTIQLPIFNERFVVERLIDLRILGFHPKRRHGGMAVEESLCVCLLVLTLLLPL